MFKRRQLVLFLSPPLMVVAAWALRGLPAASPPIVTAAALVSPAQQPQAESLASVARVLRLGDTGSDVAAVRRRLGLPPSGTYDTATEQAVRAFQSANQLDPDGAISSPGPSADRGGPSYGVYQLSSAGRNSALARFVAWPRNPFAEQLGASAAHHGLASPAFDATWRALARDHNAVFGDAQQAFLEVQRGNDVDAFLVACGAGPHASRDARLWDLAIGTLNQYGGLSRRVAAQARRVVGPTPTASELGQAIQDAKAARVEQSFASSPGAWRGVRIRIARERRVFEGS